MRGSMFGVVNKINFANSTREVYKVVYMNKDYCVLRVPGDTALIIKLQVEVFFSEEEFNEFLKSEEFGYAATYWVWSRSKQSFPYTELRDTLPKNRKRLELQRNLKSVQSDIYDIEQKLKSYGRILSDLSQKEASYQKELTSLDN